MANPPFYESPFEHHTDEFRTKDGEEILFILRDACLVMKKTRVIIAFKALITPHRESTKLCNPRNEWGGKANPRNEWGGKANPRKEWGGKANPRKEWGGKTLRLNLLKKKREKRKRKWLTNRRPVL